MSRFDAMAWIIPLAAWTFAAPGAEFHIKEVPSLESAGRPQPHVVAFADHRGDELTDPGTGLIPFEGWARQMPLQKRFLSPYPDYVEPAVNVTVDGVKKSIKESLQMYVAEARFVVAKSPQSIDLAHYAALSFLERIDPAIKHRLISTTEKESAIKNQTHDWCETKANAICIQSHYQFEGKLPMGIHLVNQLTDRKTIPDYIDFQSELRMSSPAELDEPGLRSLTGNDSSIVGVLEHNIFHVNQILKFGKFLAVLQQDRTDPNRTIVTAYVSLAVKSRILESKKKYEKIPVLRNLVPAQVLVGKSSFNTGASISAGLPVYTRNNIKAVAAILEQE
jgi:hypothetical protein